MSGLLLQAAPRIPPRELAFATNLWIAAILVVAAFFLVRPELWRRLWMQRIDPRPAGLLRIGFGLVIVWSLIGMLPDVRFLFTDEGLWTTELARSWYGGILRWNWDPHRWFRDAAGFFAVVTGKFTVLHMRSDPAFVYTLYAAATIASISMTLGRWTRTSTFLAWALYMQIARYSSVHYNAGDFVVQVYFFLGVLTRWGEAYSLDSWRRRRRAILAGAATIPALRLIPAWPQRLMMGQLAIIYCTTGLLKRGGTWSDGSALYYAMNLEQFYRYPIPKIVALLQWTGILPLMTIVVHWWEILFPLALVGMLINGYERARERGEWTQAALWRRLLSWALLSAAVSIVAWIGGQTARYYPDRIPAPIRSAPESISLTVALTIVAIPLAALVALVALRRFGRPVYDWIRRWLLGRRLWLLIGLGMHAGIKLSMNVGTFTDVMMVIYLAWLTRDDVEALERLLTTRACRPGEAERPQRHAILGWMLAPIDRLRFRTERPRILVRFRPDEPSLRRAALLRVWDVGRRLRFVADETVPRERLTVEAGSGTTLRGRQAGAVLVGAIPGLGWLKPSLYVPGLRALGSSLALAILRQRRG